MELDSNNIENDSGVIVESIIAPEPILIGDINNVEIPPPPPPTDSVSVPWSVSPQNVENSPLYNNSKAYIDWIISTGVLNHQTQDASLTQQQELQLQQANQFLDETAKEARKPRRGRKKVQAQPNYADLYTFLQSLFSQSPQEYLENFEKLSELDTDLVYVLAHNLALNVNTPEFQEAHKTLVSDYTSIANNIPQNNIPV